MVWYVRALFKTYKGSGLFQRRPLGCFWWFIHLTFSDSRTGGNGNWVRVVLLFFLLLFVRLFVI